MKIIVTEIQKFADGGMSTPSYAFDSQQAAEAKYHAILAGAAVSALPMHACVMFSEEGFPSSTSATSTRRQRARSNMTQGEAGQPAPPCFA